MKVCREALTSGKSAVIDNTNPDKESRARYINIANELKVPARCFWFDYDKKVCMHNNKQRKINTHRTHMSKKVGDVIIHTFYKKMEKPILEEGFQEIKTIKFTPGPFENDDDKKIYLNS